MSEQVLSMPPAPLPRWPAREVVRRSRALAVLAGLALLIHALLLGGVQWTWPDVAPRLPALEVRTIGATATATPSPVALSSTPTEAGNANLESAPHEDRDRLREAARKPQALRSAARIVEAARPTVSLMDVDAAHAPVRPRTTPPTGAGQVPARAETQDDEPTVSAQAQVQAQTQTQTQTQASAAVESAASAAPEAALFTDASIPLYRTRIPPPATLHYTLRRGSLRGNAEMQWRPTAEGYALRLDGSIAGATVLSQTSEGGFDAAGLAPLRYTDRRQRRQLLATNFQREAGKISFSGSSNEFALRRGAQDRLTWMLQLAAVAAAEPERLVPGGVIEIAVAGVRGDVAVWAFRCAGVESVDTEAGPLPAVKLVRESAGPYDTTVAVWLDPQRDYFPLRVLLRSANDAQTLELALQRLEPER
ncbi:MAG: hypothetical protein ABI156_00135 [Caldimonas sp.]